MEVTMIASYGIAALVVALLLLLARGAYLIGSGSKAEQRVRMQAHGSQTLRAGFQLLDGLRNAEIPIVSALERRLGLDDEND